MWPTRVRILVCTEPQDLRRSFDGLALAVRERLGEDPQSGVIVAFANKRMNRPRLLWWDRSGYCLLYKRLHRARVQLPIGADSAHPAVQIDANALVALLAGVLGSADGALANTTFPSLLASCQMHQIEPSAYLPDLFCLLPDWPARRALELAPVAWRQTLEQPEAQQRLAANPFRALSLGRTG
jgi:transposase